MINLYELLINFLVLVGMFAIMIANGFGAWLLFNAWLDAKREKQKQERLSQFREAAKRLERLREGQE